MPCQKWINLSKYFLKMYVGIRLRIFNGENQTLRNALGNKQSNVKFVYGKTWNFATVEDSRSLLKDLFMGKDWRT